MHGLHKATVLSQHLTTNPIPESDHSQPQSRDRTSKKRYLVDCLSTSKETMNLPASGVNNIYESPSSNRSIVVLRTMVLENPPLY